MTSRTLSDWEDQLVLAAYFLLIFLIGIWSMYRANRQTVTGYFLAGRSMMWLPVGASLYSSNIGAEHFVGLASSGAASGIVNILYEWLSMILLLMLGWLFLPVYISAGVYTMPEYLEKRFGGKRIRIYLSCLAMVLYIIAKLASSGGAGTSTKVDFLASSACIYAGAIFIQMAAGWNMYLSVMVLLLITGIFTVLGGLTTVIYTDAIQTVIMVVGSIILMAIGFHEIGGYENLKVRYMNATATIHFENSTCGYPREDAFSVVRDPVDSDNPFPALALFVLYGCIWYWCCDQVIVQRALAAKTLSHAKAGSLLAGYLKILPLFTMVFPGMISRALFPDEVGCITPDECEKFCGNPVGCSNSAYPQLVMELLPKGLRGLVLAGMMSAIISSLSSIFNSSSTLFTMDLWPRIRKSTTQREQLIAGRIFIVVMAALSICWVPLVKAQQSGGLFVYMNVVQSYIATPISPVFVFAVFWKRTTEKAAFWSLIIGQCIGIIRMALDFTLTAPVCGEPETRPKILYKVHYAYFGVLLSVITSLCIVVISLLTTPRTNVDGLTFWTRHKTTWQPETKERVDVEMKDMISVNNTSCHDIETSRAKHWLYKICGIPESTENVNTSAERERIQKEEFLKETFGKRLFLDINAVLAAVAIAVLIIYFR